MGGQFDYARRIPGKEEFSETIRYYQTQIARTGVHLRLSHRLTVAELKVPYIAMHMQGTPETMQEDPQYEDAVSEVRDYLRTVCDSCNDAGIADIIIDPGFGFGKTVQHNYQLLNALHTFRMLGKPVLAGLSRKSMVCKPLHVNPEHALNGTTALHMVALQQGASILRAHDVKEAMEVIKLYEQFDI